MQVCHLLKFTLVGEILEAIKKNIPAEKWNFSVYLSMMQYFKLKEEWGNVLHVFFSLNFGFTFKIFDTVVLERVEMSSDMFHLGIEAASMKAQKDKITQIFKIMERTGIRPDSITANIALSGGIFLSPTQFRSAC
jgi:hypothetical protein